jgi:hypothetical protein
MITDTLAYCIFWGIVSLIGLGIFGFILRVFIQIKNEMVKENKNLDAIWEIFEDLRQFYFKRH